MAESFFGTIKVELVYRHVWRSRHDAELGIFRRIEGWYNPRRIQRALGWRTPLEYEQAYRAGQGPHRPRHRQVCAGARRRQAARA
jgi:putative transposase